MLFAGKRAARSGLAATTSTLLALAVMSVGASAQDTCTYDATQCSNYNGQTGSGTSPTTPGSGTLPTSAQSGRASLAATRSCTKTSFPVTVSGRAMQRVTIYVNGRLAKRVAVKSTATRVTTRLPTPVATSKLTIKVAFTSASGTKARTFTRTVKRCVPAAVSPNFTG
jgi:hypothetical protein